MFTLTINWSYHANTTEPLDGGHLSKAGKFSGPEGVRFRQVLLYNAS